MTSLRKIKLMDEANVDISATNPLEVNNAAAEIAQYLTQDLWEVGSVTYVGKVNNAGVWLFLEIDETTDLTIRYANVSNNVTMTTYALASTNRLTLTYEFLEDITF